MRKQKKITYLLTVILHPARLWVQRCVAVPSTVVCKISLRSGYCTYYCNLVAVLYGWKSVVSFVWRLRQYDQINRLSTIENANFPHGRAAFIKRHILYRATRKRTHALCVQRQEPSHFHIHSATPRSLIPERVIKRKQLSWQASTWYDTIAEILSYM